MDQKSHNEGKDQKSHNEGKDQKSHNEGKDQKSHNEGKDQKETVGFLYSFKETRTHHSPRFQINVFGQICVCLYCTQYLFLV